MAYAKKYELTWADHLGTTFTAELWQDNFAGASTSIKAKGVPCHVKMLGSGDLYDIMKGGECTFTPYSETNFAFVDFFNSPIGDIYILLKKSGTTYWSGTYPADTYNEPYIDIPYPTEMRFTDLADLKSIRYENAGALRTGYDSCLNIILNCLNELPAGVQKNIIEIINVFENNMTGKTVTDGLLAQLYLDQRDFIEEDESEVDRGMFCYDVIDSILTPLGCRIYQYDNQWWIVRVGEMNQTTPRYLEYNTAGALVGSGTKTMRQNITNNTGAKDLTWDQTADMHIQEIYSRLRYVYEYSFFRRPDNNMIRNPVFTNEKGAPSLIYWQLNVTGGAVGVRTLIPHPPIKNGGFRSLTGKRLNTLYYTPAVIAASEKSNVKKFSDLTINTASWVRPIENTGDILTQSQVSMDTADSFLLSMDWLFEKYSETDLGPLLSSTNLNYKVKVYVMVKIVSGSTWYLDNQTTSSFQWTTGAGVKYAEFEVTLDRISKGLTVFEKKISVQTPVFPISGVFDIDVKVFTPVSSRITFNDMIIGGAGIIRDGFFLNSAAMSKAILTYLEGGEVNIERVDEVSVATTGREKEWVWKVRHGDGPSEVALGGFRLSTKAVTSQWHLRGSGVLKSAKDIFLFDDGKSFLSDNRREIRGTLKSAQTSGYIEFFKSLLEPASGGNKLYMIDSIDYDVKDNSYVVVLIQLVAFARTWTDTVPTDVSGLAPDDGHKTVPITVGDTIDQEMKDITEIDSEIVRPDITAVVDIISPTDWAAFPDSGPSDQAALWNFQDMPLGVVTSVKDYSQNENTSDVVTNVTAVAGEVGQAGRFDGATSEVRMGNITQVDGVANLSCWARVNKDLNQSQFIVVKDLVFRLVYLVGGQARFSVYIGAWRDVISTSTPSTGVWHTIHGVYNGVDLRIYTDGVLDCVPVAQVGNVNTNAANGYMGSRGGAIYFDGDIGNVGVTPTAHTPAEVAAVSGNSYGINIKTDGHLFDEGDLVATDETNQTKMVVTHAPDTTNVRAIPADANRLAINQRIGRFGNCFDLDRQASSHYAAKLVAGVLQPELVFWDDVAKFAEYDTQPKEVVRLDKRGITAKSTRGDLYGWDINYASPTRLDVAAKSTYNYCRDALNQDNIETLTPLTFDTAVVGVAGGIDAGPLAINSWYYIFAIGDSTRTNLSNTLGSLSQAPLMPATHDLFRHIGWIWIDAGGAIRAFFQTIYGNNSTLRNYEWLLDFTALSPVMPAGGSSIAWAAIPMANWFPPTIGNRWGYFMTDFTKNGGPPGGLVWYRPLGSASNVPTIHIAEPGIHRDPVHGYFQMTVIDQIIEYRVDNVADVAQVHIQGFQHDIDLGL